MKNRTLVARTLIALFISANSSFVNAEDIRIVVSYDANVVNQTAFKNPITCLKTLDRQRNICVPTPPTAGMTGKASAKKSSVKPNNVYKVMSLDADSNTQVIETLTATGWYNTVEVDVQIRTPITQAVIAYPMIKQNDFDENNLDPNDPGYTDQKAYFGSPNLEEVESLFSNYKTGIDFNKAKLLTKNSDKKVTVAILDSSFWQNDDVSFVTGAQMSTIWDNVRGSEFIGEKESDRIVCGSHGFGVAGSIAAKSNNGILVTGAVDNVDMIGVNVMDCGVGFLSDAADGLRWIAGESVDGIADYSGDKVVVANLSLGGSTGECPIYMQESIDIAVAAGITVVVAAGNQNINVKDFTPANCENIVVVASLTKNGDRSTFSNYGNGVDVATIGENIVSTGYDDENLFYWEGTSFAAPLVTAAIAHAKREAPNLTPLAMKQLLKATVTPLVQVSEVEYDGCEILNCGTGQVNAGTLVEWAQLLSGSNESSQIKHVLNEIANQSECDQGWIFDNFGEKLALCDTFDVSFFNASMIESPIFKLWSAPIDSSLTLDGTVLLSSTEKTIRLSDTQINFETTQYGYQICDGETCVDTMFRFSMSAIDRPEACETND